MSELTISEAINHTLKQAFAAQPQLILLETQTSSFPDTPKSTEGLQQLYGPERVIITPQLSGISWVAIGMASNKLKPIIHITNDYSLHHAISHLQQKQHSIIIHAQTPHAQTIPFTQELIIVTPATPTDAQGLYLSALTSRQPVLFLEPSSITHTIKEEIPEEATPIPLCKAGIIQEGDEITLITWGTGVQESKKALRELPQYSAEIINLRTLTPFDQETVLESVKKTGRAIIIEEGHSYKSFSAEITARIQERARHFLKAPVLSIMLNINKEHNQHNLANQLENAIAKVINYSRSQ